MNRQLPVRSAAQDRLVRVVLEGGSRRTVSASCLAVALEAFELCVDVAALGDRLGRASRCFANVDRLGRSAGEELREALDVGDDVLALRVGQALVFHSGIAVPGIPSSITRRMSASVGSSPLAVVRI